MATKCTKCNTYLLGDFCYTCNEEVTSKDMFSDLYSDDMPDIFKQMFGGDNEKRKTNKRA